MPIRDLIHKKDKIANAQSYDDDAPQLSLSPPPIPTFIRSDTTSFEVITPPSLYSPVEPHDGPTETRPSRLSIFKNRSRSNSNASTASPTSPTPSSNRISLFRRERSSSRVPENLPDIASITIEDSTRVKGNDGERAERKAAKEAQWEERATKLAQQNEREMEDRSPANAGPSSIGGLSSPEIPSLSVSSPGADDNIQEAIRLHESGDLKRSTSMFGRLADQGSALAMVLYGLALRHGWGIDSDAQRAVTYLSAAASNAATIESLALQAGMKNGGAAKGELVLAIFELANCFRYAYGVPKDAVAAKQYYETAANLGDTDAMNEVGWCYLEGFGCKKDKLAAAKYYRLAETAGNRTLGNSWIWKAKYDPK